MRLTAYILFVSVLVGCATPQKLEEPIDAAASKCVRDGKAISAVEACLSSEGIVLENMSRLYGKDVRRYSKCRPAFRILMTSCAWLHVEVNDEGTVSKWLVGNGYDGP